MQIIPFPAHYQSVYTNFDISSFSLISCVPKGAVLQCKRACFVAQKGGFWNVETVILKCNCIYMKKDQHSASVTLQYVSPVGNAASIRHSCYFGLLFALVLQEAFSLDGSLCTTSGSHHSLAIDWVGNVAGSENTFYACGSRRSVGYDEALRVEF